MKRASKQWESRLGELYCRIRDCHLCPMMDAEKCLRRTDAVSVEEMDVLIVSQSLAANQLRRSGVNFFMADGTIGATGLILHRFLRKFGRTVYPPSGVVLSNGNVISRREEGFRSVYNTEIAQCYPGKALGKNGHRRPTPIELSACTKQGFLLEELQIVNPRLVLLMGSASYEGFYENVLRLIPRRGLTQEIENIVAKMEIPDFCVSGRMLKVLPIQHASGANPRFAKMANDPLLMQLIRGAL
jgi:uracil-DNA glycosylase